MAHILQRIFSILFYWRKKVNSQHVSTGWCKSLGPYKRGIFTLEPVMTHAVQWRIYVSANIKGMIALDHYFIRNTSLNKIGSYVQAHRRGYQLHDYSEIIMRAMAFQTFGVSNFCSTVCSDVDHRKHQSSESLAFVREIHRWPMDSPHK